MTDCPHIHEQDTAIQAFSDIIREETDGGRDLVRFFTNAMFDKGFMFDEINRAELRSAYKDWCVSNRINPVSARRLYKSVWEVLRVDTHNTNGRRLFRGVQLIPEAVPTGAESAGSA